MTLMLSPLPHFVCKYVVRVTCPGCHMPSCSGVDQECFISRATLPKELAAPAGGTALPQLQSALPQPNSTLPAMAAAVASPDMPRAECRAQHWSKAYKQHQHIADLQSMAASSPEASSIPAVGFGLPPIPALPAQLPSKNRRGAAHKRQASVQHQAIKSAASPKNAYSYHGKGHAVNQEGPKQAPAWNSDFSIAYDKPVSIKDQERVISHMTKACTKQPSAAGRAGQFSASKASLQASPDSRWPVLDSFIKQPVGKPARAPSKLPTLRPADCQHNKSVMARSTAEVSVHGGEEVAHNAGRHARQLTKASHAVHGSKAYGRNLDSAHSPLRPYKGKRQGLHELPQLWEMDKFCFLPVQVRCS